MKLFDGKGNALQTAFVDTEAIIVHAHVHYICDVIDFYL